VHRARRVDEDAGRELARRFAPDAQHEAVRNDFRRFERRAQRERAAVALEVAEVGQHQRMAVDDPGDRRQQRGFATQRRFERDRLAPASQRRPARRSPPRGGRWSASESACAGVRRDDELAAAPMRHAVRLAVRVQLLAAGDAEARLQRGRRVVQAGMDHLAVARADAVADAAGRLEERASRARARERAPIASPITPAPTTTASTRSMRVAP
jgi:hypothetical protein